MSQDARVGDIIELDFTTDPYTRLEPGDRGEVTFIDSLGTIHAHWESGSTMGVVPGVDGFHVITRKE